MPDPIQITANDVTPEVHELSSATLAVAALAGMCTPEEGYTSVPQVVADLREAVALIRQEGLSDVAEPEPPTVAITDKEGELLHCVATYLESQLRCERIDAGYVDQTKREIDCIHALLARAAKSDELCVVRREDAQFARDMLIADATGEPTIVDRRKCAAAADRFSAAFTDGTPQRGEGAG